MLFKMLNYFSNKLLVKSFSSLISLAINLLTIITISNSLSRSDYGIFNYLITISSLSVVILSAGFSNSFVYHFSKNEDMKDFLVKLFLALNILSAFIFLIISLIIIDNKYLYETIFSVEITP